MFIKIINKKVWQAIVRETASRSRDASFLFSVVNQFNAC
jgi:hypothetical protein